MSYLVVPFKRWHLNWLEDRGAAEGGSGPILSFDMLRQLEHENSWTGVYDGDPIACGGTIRHWPGRHLAWAHLNANTARHMTFITRAAREAIARAHGRVEITVRAGFKPGLRDRKSVV